MNQLIPLVDLKAQYIAIKDEIDEAISRVIDNSSFCSGVEVELFENEFAKYCRSKYAIGVDNGTSAIQLALLSCGIGKGDEIITVSHTFAATVEAICSVGATPVFADIDPKTYTLDVSWLSRLVTGRTKAILPVHIYGQMCDMTPIINFAKYNRLFVIEDACQSHGARYFYPSGEYKKSGTIGDLGCFSFYPSKNLGAYGHGGMIVTDNKEKADFIRQYKSHGQSKRYYHDIVGHNQQLDDLQASILRVKLGCLDSWNLARKTRATWYGSFLQDDIVPFMARHGYHVFHLYVIRTLDRDRYIKLLSDKEIGYGIHYPIPVHLQKGYKFLGYKKGDLPITESLCDSIISLPMYPELSYEQVEFIAGALKEIHE